MSPELFVALFRALRLLVAVLSDFSGCSCVLKAFFSKLSRRSSPTRSFFFIADTLRYQKPVARHTFKAALAKELAIGSKLAQGYSSSEARRMHELRQRHCPISRVEVRQKRKNGGPLLAFSTSAVRSSIRIEFCDLVFSLVDLHQHGSGAARVFLSLPSAAVPARAAECWASNHDEVYGRRGTRS